MVRKLERPRGSNTKFSRLSGRTRCLWGSAVPLLALVTAGCGYPSQFHTSLLLPTLPGASALAALQLAEPPFVRPDLFLEELPSISAGVSLKPVRCNGLVERAEQAFERGQAAYRTGDIPNARREFDTAIDLMLDASEENPKDPQDYDKRLDELVDAIHRYDLAGMGSSIDIENAEFEKAPLEDILPMTFPVDPRLEHKVRDEVAATVSQLPLTVSDPVLGYVHYFSNRGHRTLIAGTERSGRFRPMIQRILAEEGVPQELIHLAQAESGFMPRAMSRKAAKGLWQFLPWRGREYGLIETAYTDDRMDPEKATRAAAHHLHDLYNEFGDWYLAIAAYNCGPGTVEKAVRQTGYADFWELRNRGALPAETANYVPIILAMTIMEKNPAEYGLDRLALDPPLEYDTVEIAAPTSMALLCDLTETAVPDLFALNPALLKSVVPPGYSLRVPKGKGGQLMASLQPIPAEHRISWRMHRVAAGETLAALGKRFGVTSSSIVSANGLRTSEAAAGDWLMIPTALRGESTLRHTVSVRATASRRRTPARRVAALNAGARTASLLASDSRPVGDNLVRTVPQ